MERRGVSDVYPVQLIGPACVNLSLGFWKSFQTDIMIWENDENLSKSEYCVSIFQLFKSIAEECKKLECFPEY